MSKVLTNITKTKVAVITGSSTGIGLAVVKALLKRNPAWVVYLTSRNEERGMEAVERVNREVDLLPAFYELDVNSLDSIRSFYSHIRLRHRRIDVLVNNAGVYPKQIIPNQQLIRANKRRVFSFDMKLVRQIINTNYFGTLNVCRFLIPLLSDDARVVNVSSSMSQFAFNQLTPALQDEIRGCRTIDDVSQLINSFLALSPPDYVESGWLSRLTDENGYFYGDIIPYGLSKIGVNLITQIFQRQLDADLKDEPEKCVLVNACSPGGSVKTDSNPNGRKTPEEAGEILANLATLPKDSQLRGSFVHERRVHDPLTGVALSSQE